MNKKMNILILSFFVCLYCVASLLAATTQYTYDSLDRLVKVQYDNGTVIEYTYDAAGNRLTKSVTGAPTEALSPITSESPAASGLSGQSPSPSPLSTKTFSKSVPQTRSFAGQGLSPGATVGEAPSLLPPGEEPGAAPPVSRDELAGVGPKAGDQETEIAAVAQTRGGDSPPALAAIPAPPDQLKVLAAPGKVVLSWQHASGDQVGFIIQRQEGADQEKFGEIARLANPGSHGAAGLTWTDEKVRPGQTYRYRVAASNSSGISSFSPPLEVTVK